MYSFLKQLMIPQGPILQGSSKFWGMQYTYNFIQIIETKSMELHGIDKTTWLLVVRCFF